MRGSTPGSALIPYTTLCRSFGRLGRGPGGILTAIIVLVVVGLLMSSYTIIDARQVGVVLRFGEYSRTLPPGFHLKLRSEEHTSELQSHVNLVCRLLLEKKKK